jgi:hypothetical protein
MVTGTPARGGIAAPERIATVRRSASARACSYIGVTTTLQAASAAFSAAIVSSTTSRGVNTLRR